MKKSDKAEEAKEKKVEYKEEKGMKKAKKAIDEMIGAHKGEMKSMGLKSSLKKGGKVAPKKGKK